MLKRQPVAPVLVRFVDLDEVCTFTKQGASATLGAARDGSTKLHVLASASLLEHGDVERTLFPIFPICGRAISSMRIEEMDSNPFLIHHVDLVKLFEAFSAMPSLVDLAIKLQHGRDLTPEIKTAPVSFCLRRLDLHRIFRGWHRLITQSGTTLRDLTLRDLTLSAGPSTEGPYRHNPADGSLDMLRSVNRLHLEDVFDPALVGACTNLHSLALVIFDNVYDSVMPCLDVAPPTLQHLTLGVEETESGFEVWDVIDLFGSSHPAMTRLRQVTMQPCLEWMGILQPDLDSEGLGARDVLQNLCRQRRIALSLFE